MQRLEAESEIRPTDKSPESDSTNREREDRRTRYRQYLDVFKNERDVYSASPEGAPADYYQSRDRYLDGRDDYVQLEIQRILTAGVEAGLDCSEYLKDLLSEADRLLDDGSEPRKDVLQAQAFYLANALLIRTWSEKLPGSLCLTLKNEGSSDGEINGLTELFELQSTKRRAALEIVEQTFGKLELVGHMAANDGKDGRFCQQLLRSLMDHSIDPDFGDHELATRIYSVLPEEMRCDYGQDERIFTLVEARLARYRNYTESNVIPTDNNRNQCLDREQLQRFFDDELESLDVDGQEITRTRFGIEKKSARICIDTSFDALCTFFSDLQYRTIYESRQAQEEWEEANPGYISRRLEYDRILGIDAKGTDGDRPVVSGYLMSNGLDSNKQPNGQYGKFRLRLKPQVVERSGFVRGDAVRMKDRLPEARLSLDAAILCGGFSRAFSKSRHETYIEAQIYNGVSLEDVEDVTLAGKCSFSSENEQVEFVSSLVGQLGSLSVLNLARRMPNFRHLIKKGLQIWLERQEQDPDISAGETESLIELSRGLSD